jgi:hypothetical protein
VGPTGSEERIPSPAPNKLATRPAERQESRPRQKNVPSIDLTRSHHASGPATLQVMSSHLAGGLVLGLAALILGVGLAAAALRRRRMREANAPTYAATGGPLYMAFQLGCAGLLIVAGMLLLAIMVLTH